MREQGVIGDRSDAIGEICRRYGVRELLLFGSALRPDFNPDSDIDLLVEFDPTVRIGLVQFIRLKHELESLFNRKVDLVPKHGLKSLVRENVLHEAKLVYAG